MIPFLPIAFSTILYPDDKQFASALCNKKKDAMSEFLELYSDELYFIASKYCNKGIPEEHWSYRTKTGYTINVSDCVSDAYLWLFESIVLNRSCRFRGEDGASFEGYIIIVLNDDRTFISWKRRRTNNELITTPGSTGYIPKCIDVLSEIHKEIYTLLRQNKSEQDICKAVNIDFVDYLDYYNTIEEKLMESNQLQLLRKPRISSIDQSADDNERSISPRQLSEDMAEISIKGKVALNPENVPDFEITKNIIQSFLDNLSTAERRLLILWGVGYSIKEISESEEMVISKQFKEELNIHNEKSIYKKIDSLILKSIKYFEDAFPSLRVENRLLNKEMKIALKSYFTLYPGKIKN